MKKKLLNKIKFITQRGFIEGGSTKPILIEAVNNQDEIGQYVLKLFTKDQEQKNFSTSKEFISSLIASEFDVNSPECFVVQLHKSYVIDLYSEQELKNYDFNYHFCTKFIDGCVTFNPNSHNKFLSKYDFANVFAFDFLVLNMDRERRKPNLLIKDDDFYVIDHELTFPFYSRPRGVLENHTKQVFYSQMNAFNVSSHIFYHFMKKQNKDESCFNEFEDNLRRLNFNKIQELFKDFSIFNILNEGINSLTDYLLWCKRNNYVIDLLRKKIG